MHVRALWRSLEGGRMRRMTPIDAAIAVLLARCVVEPSHAQRVVDYCRIFGPDSVLADVAAACQLAAEGLDWWPLAEQVAQVPLYTISGALNNYDLAPRSSALLDAIAAPEAVGDKGVHRAILAVCVAAFSPEFVHGAIEDGTATPLPQLAPALVRWASQIARHGARRSPLERAAAAEVRALIACEVGDRTAAAKARDVARQALAEVAA